MPQRALCAIQMSSGKRQRLCDDLNMDEVNFFKAYHLINTPICVLGANRGVTFFNNAFTKVFGHTWKESLYDRDIFVSDFGDTPSESRPSEVNVKHANGSISCWQVCVTDQLDGGVILVFTEIPKKCDILCKALQPLSVGVVCFDFTERLEAHSEEAEKILGYDSESLIGMKLRDLFDLPNLNSPICSAENPNSTRVVVGNKKGGGKVKLLCTVNYIPNCGYSIVFRKPANRADSEFPTSKEAQQDEATKNMPEDSDIMEMSEMTKSTKPLLRDSNEARVTEFLAHEVRNPLSVAMAATQFVRDTVLSTNSLDKETEALAAADLGLIATSLQFINEIVSASLDLEMTKAGKVVLNNTYASVWVDILLPIKSMLFREKSAVKVSCHGPENIWIMADILRVKQIILNLAKNAVKFTSEGFVRISASTSSSGMIEFSIEDSGPGVSDSAKNSLFQKYQSRVQPNIQGSGIGLSLCFSLSAAMGGEVSLDETYDSGIPGCRGSRFLLKLPLKVVSEDEVSKLVTNPTSNECSGNQEFSISGKCLIVDDDPVTRSLLKRRFKKMFPNLHTEEASAGDVALEKVSQNAKSPDPYLFIMLDYFLPSVSGLSMTGEQVVSNIRSFGCQTPVIGYSGSNVENLFLQAGADLFLTKPLPSDDDLLGKISHLLAFTPHRRILVVDNDPVCRLVLARTLKKFFKYFDLIEAESCDAALLALRQNSYDLAILDENMGGGLTGCQVVAEFKKSGPAHSPIFVSVSGGLISNPSAFSLIWGKPLPKLEEMKSDLEKVLLKNDAYQPRLPNGG